MSKLLEEMRAKAWEEGRRAGLKEAGRMVGFEEGKRAAKTDVALRMLDIGTYSLEAIVKISGLTSDEVKALSLSPPSRKA